MASEILDSCALVKCWVQEKGTPEMRERLADADAGTLYASALSGAEVAAAIVRASRDNRIAADAATQALVELRAMLRGPVCVVSVTEELMGRAMDLAEAHGLRGADSVQLATACEIGEIQAAVTADPVRLVTADQDLLDAAAKERLVTWNPEVGPPDGGS